MLILLVVLLVIVVIGIVFFQINANDSSNSIKIGASIALTGAASDWGADELKAITMAIDNVNLSGGIGGKHILLFVEDTRSDPKDTLNATIKLIDVDGVKAIIGPTWGDSFGELVGPIGEKKEIVQITPSGALEIAEDIQDFKYFFSTWPPQLPEAKKHMEFINSQGFKKIVIIHDQDPFNTKFSKMYEKEAKSNGIQIVSVIEIPVGERDFRTLIQKTKVTGADAIFISIFEPQELGLILKTMKELGVNMKVLATASAQTSKLLDEFSEVAENNIYFSYLDNNTLIYGDFENKFFQKYGYKPISPSAGTAYDATNVLLEAIKESEMNKLSIKDALYSISTSGVVMQKISFDSKGQVQEAPFVIKTVRNKEFVVLYR